APLHQVKNLRRKSFIGLGPPGLVDLGERRLRSERLYERPATACPASSGRWKQARWRRCGLLLDLRLILAKAGIQEPPRPQISSPWIPVCAGMTRRRSNRAKAPPDRLARTSRRPANVNSGGIAKMPLAGPRRLGRSCQCGFGVYLTLS